MNRAVLRVVSLALLALLLLVSFLSLRTLRRLPNVVLYYVQSNETNFSLAPVAKRIASDSFEQKITSIIDALKQQPSEAGLSSSFPETLEVLNVQRLGSEVIVDVSTEFEQGGGSALMMARLNQLFYTLTQLEEVSEVSLFIEGVRVNSFSQQGILIDNPWLRTTKTLPIW